MFFFTKKSKLILECFTSHQPAYDFSQVDYAKKFIPEWWKKTHKYENLVHPDGSEKYWYPRPSIKTCPGFIDLFKNGAIIPMWSEFAMEIGALGDTEYRWQWANEDSSSVVHPASQYNYHYDPKEYCHMKLHSPWIFRCNQDVDWLWSQPTWNMDSLTDYTVLPGVINHKYIGTANINIFAFRKAEKRVLFIKAGQPIVHLAPMSNKELVIKSHVVDPSEMKRLEFGRRHFMRAYEENKKVRQCPF